MAQPAREQQQAQSGRSANDVVHSSTSHDVVFAIVGYAGAGPGWVARQLIAQLRQHGFAPIPIKVSDQIKTAAKNLNLPKPLPGVAKVQETQWLQEA